MPDKRVYSFFAAAASLAFHLAMYPFSLSLQPVSVSTEHRLVPPISSMYACMFSFLPSSSHIASDVFLGYGLPPGPVSLLKYRMVGHPPAPGFCGSPFISLTWSCERLTSQKATSGLSLNFFVISFQAGACLTHQPHPSEAIHRTKAVLPASSASFTKASVLSFVHFCT